MSRGGSFARGQIVLLIARAGRYILSLHYCATTVVVLSRFVSNGFAFVMNRDESPPPIPTSTVVSSRLFPFRAERFPNCEAKYCAIYIKSRNSATAPKVYSTFRTDILYVTHWWINQKCNFATSFKHFRTFGPSSRRPCTWTTKCFVLKHKVGAKTGVELISRTWCERTFYVLAAPKWADMPN